MPANLTPQYKQAEERFRAAATHDEKLDALREMIALLPKHKGTEKLYADLKKRLAKLEEEGAHTHRGATRHDDPGHVRREGAGQWVLVGPPNAGKSALLAALTNAHPEVAPYPFTTRVPLPGMMAFEDLLVQLVDTPPVSPQHAEAWLTNLVCSIPTTTRSTTTSRPCARCSSARRSGPRRRRRPATRTRGRSSTPCAPCSTSPTSTGTGR